MHRSDPVLRPRALRSDPVLCVRPRALSALPCNTSSMKQCEPLLNPVPMKAGALQRAIFSNIRNNCSLTPIISTT